tara:strand:- start:72 stop:386 length:315 start_codon:yes stop_codon:yes gene_type:complete
MNTSGICKRIAEIEGLRVSKDVKPQCGGAYASAHIDKPYGSYKVYNPLTDDALCFKLMIKYRIDFGTLEYSGKHCVSWALDGNLIEENPNKAICLAIIEANKGK